MLHKLQAAICFLWSPKQNSVDLVRKRTIPTSDSRLSAKLGQLLWLEDVAWSAQRIPTAVNPGFLEPEPLLFNPSSSSVILTRLSGPRSKQHYYSENLVAPGIQPGTSGSVARNSGHIHQN
jgi:hypothetical protein